MRGEEYLVLLDTLNLTIFFPYPPDFTYKS
jgi:hypothetical protein